MSKNCDLCGKNLIFSNCDPESEYAEVDLEEKGTKQVCIRCSIQIRDWSIERNRNRRKELKKGGT